LRRKKQKKSTMRIQLSLIIQILKLMSFIISDMNEIGIRKNLFGYFLRKNLQIFGFQHIKHQIWQSNNKNLRQILFLFVIFSGFKSCVENE
jgi:hypothetical protein